MAPSPPTEQAAMARRAAASRVSSVLSGVGRRSAIGSGCAKRRDDPSTHVGRKVGPRRHEAGQVGAGRGVAAIDQRPRRGRNVAALWRRACALRLPWCSPRCVWRARPLESVYSSGDSASARGFDSPGVIRISIDTMMFVNLRRRKAHEPDSGACRAQAAISFSRTLGVDLPVRSQGMASNFKDSSGASLNCMKPARGWSRSMVIQSAVPMSNTSETVIGALRRPARPQP